MHQLKVARRPLTCSKEPLIGDLEVIDKKRVYMFITFLLPPISWLIEFEKLQVQQKNGEVYKGKREAK